MVSNIDSREYTGQKTAIKKRPIIKISLFLSSIPIMLSVLYLFLSTPQYAAIAIIAPVTNDPRLETDNRPSISSNSLSSLIAGGGANLNQPILQLITLLRTEALAGILLKDSRVQQALLRVDSKTPPEALDPYTAMQIINSKFVEEEITKTPFLKITFFHPNPEDAAYILQNMVERADDLIKSREKEIVKSYVSFLNEQLKTETTIDQRATLRTLLERYTTKLVLTSVERPYAASFLQPVVTSTKPVSPRKVIVLGIGLAFAITLGIGTLYMHSLLTKTDDSHE